MNFEIAENPKVYSKKVTFTDGTVTELCNLERPSLVFDENGNPERLFCASGNGSSPYAFNGTTFVVSIDLKK